jgi:M6 family metalloprotease-like protein
MMIVCRAFGVPAYPYPVEVQQPDGSKVLLMIRGDERGRYVTNVMGDRVLKGKDGFYRATFSAGTLTRSSDQIHVSPVKYKSVGEISALIIPAEFQDVKFKVAEPQNHFEKMVNGDNYTDYGATGSVRSYFEENLKGVVNVKFDVAEKVTLSKDLSFYGENVQDRSVGIVKYDARVDDMIREACSIANGAIDFSGYNYVFVFFAGYSEAESGDPDTIWPSSMDLSTDPIVFDGSRIVNVACGSELRGNAGGIPSGIGAFCHEFGHVLGLPDLYDVDYDENGRGKGMWGTLSLMDYGCYNNQGRTPPYLNAIEREILGVGSLRISMNVVHELEPINLNGRFYRVDTYREGEYYLIEARREKGWDAYIGGEGMLVYHIDKSSEVAGMIQADVRWKNNLVNTYSEHECADLVESLPSAVNVKEVFFPGLGNVSSLATLTVPHFVDWSMRGVGIKLVDIKLNPSGDGVSFVVKKDNDEILLSASDIIVVPEQRDVHIRWNTSMDMDVKWGVRWRKDGEEFSKASEKVVNDREVLIDNLRGGQSYLCQIFHIGFTSNGDTASVKFRTKDVTSHYPYIYGLDRHIVVGDTVRLKVYNLNEVEESLVWFLNGEEVPGDHLVFDRVGKNEVSVRIRYVIDGSEETITKIVSVNGETGGV